MNDIHSCSYSCDRPECIKAQRDELAAAAAKEASAIEQIAQQWDGCMYDSVGETIDIGEAIRAAGKRLSSQPAAAQEAVGEMVRMASGITVPQMYGPPLPAGTKLYAAPVTAAPGIDPHALGLLEVLGAKDFAEASNIVGGLLADASPKGALPALPDDFSESKDWRAGSYAERVGWLMDTVRSQREHIDDLLDSSKGSATEYCIDRAVEAFDDVFDGVSNNKREAIAAALAAGVKDSPKGGSYWEATDADIAAWVARNDLGGSFGSKTDARAAFEDARSAEQATSAEVKP